jgi:hypothetical protein
VKRYRKFFVASGGVALLIGLRYFEVEIPGFDAVVRDLIVGTLVSWGVYQVPNAGASE